MGGRSPNCEKAHTNKRAWTEAEDRQLIAYIQARGADSWPSVPKAAGLRRSDKSCRLRWINYLRPDVKRGSFTEDEEETIINLHSILGNKWSVIANYLPGRTDNDIRNYWNTNIRRKLLKCGIDPVTHSSILTTIWSFLLTETITAVNGSVIDLDLREMSAATDPGEYNPTIESPVDNGSYTFSDHLGGYWSEKTSSSSISGSVPENFGAIKEKVKSVLGRITNFLSGNILVQFWAATTIEGQCYLTTSDQPFGLRNSARALCSYRMRSVTWKFNVDVERGEDELGLLGRVFRHELPESTPDVQYYSINEYPQRSHAVHCGIRGSFALPVFESSGRCCVGVLEVVDTAETYCLDIEIREVYTTLQEANLNHPNMHFPFGMQVWGGPEEVNWDIRQLVNEVCTTHKLPLALVWIPVKRNSAVTKEIVVCIRGEVYDTDNPELWEFSNASRVHLLRRGQGLVGKALLLHKPCFCRDITKLSITNYPMAHYAIKAKLNGCFAICLQSTYTGNDDYILELFLPPNKTHNGDPQIMLDSLLATMKQHSQSLKVRGEELEEKLSVEVFEISRTNLLDSSNICGATTGFPPRPEALENEGEVVQLDSPDQQLIGEDALQNGSNVIGAEQNNIAVTCLEKTCIAKMSEREHRTTKISFRREVLEQYFGMTLDDAAKSLGVSRPSLKRACRENGIERWPLCKRNRVNRSHSILKKGNDSCQGSEEQVMESGRRDPSCSHLPPKQATTVAHTIPQVAPMRDVSTVDIKATYGGDIIKFKLSFSSGVTDLREKVAKRLDLEAGTFKLKYEDGAGDLVLITCDDDLLYCMDSLRSLDCPIKMFVLPL